MLEYILALLVIGFTFPIGVFAGAYLFMRFGPIAFLIPLGIVGLLYAVRLVVGFICYMQERGQHE